MLQRLHTILCLDWLIRDPQGISDRSTWLLPTRVPGVTKAIYLFLFDEAIYGFP